MSDREGGAMTPDYFDNLGITIDMSTLSSMEQYQIIGSMLFDGNVLQRAYKEYVRPILFRRYHLGSVKRFDALQLQVKQEFLNKAVTLYGEVIKP
jgi:hypothetical protein